MKEKTSRKIVYFVTGGGTGGHIYPALAVISELKKDSNIEVFYLGSKKKLEYELLKDKNINFLDISFKGMPRKISFSLLTWVFQLLFTTMKSLYFILKYRPKVAFMTGGYVCAPTVIACMFLRVPYMIHDCDAVPGLVSKFSSYNAECASICFDEASKKLKAKKIHLNGNPIRDIFKEVDKDTARNVLKIEKNRFVIVIFGGSQGATSLNNSVLGLKTDLINKCGALIIHQTGKKNYEEIKSKAEEDENYIIRPYFEEIVYYLKAADIVVSRAGSLSISEICASGVPSILIPYPFAANNHQLMNAKNMERHGACILVRDDEKLEENLKKSLYSLIENKSLRNQMKEAALNLAKFDATKNIVMQLKEIVKE